MKTMINILGQIIIVLAIAEVLFFFFKRSLLGRTIMFAFRTAYKSIRYTIRQTIKFVSYMCAEYQKYQKETESHKESKAKTTKTKAKAKDTNVIQFPKANSK
jgi:cell shape-determining protein MreC